MYICNTKTTVDNGSHLSQIQKESCVNRKPNCGTLGTYTPIENK